MFWREDLEQEVAVHHVAIRERLLRHQGLGDFWIAHAQRVGEAVEAFLLYELNGELRVFRDARLHDMSDNTLQRQQPVRPVVDPELFASVVDDLR